MHQKHNPRQRRQRDRDRVGKSHPRHLHAGDVAEVAHVTAAIVGRITVEDFAIHAPGGNTDAVADAWHRGEVEDNQHEAAVSGAAKVADDGLLGILAIDPVEAFGGEVELVQRRDIFVAVIQIA